MPTVRQTTTQGGKTVVVREFQTNPPPSTGQKRKEVNKTALLPAQPPSKTQKPSSANQPKKETLLKALDQNYSKDVSCVEDVVCHLEQFEVRKIIGDSRGDREKPAAVSKNAGGENLAPDEAVADAKGEWEKSKGAEVVEEKKKAELCCSDNCSEEATIWPFKNAGRASKKVGYYKKCNVARRKAQSSKKSEGRRNTSSNMARKVL